MRSLCSKALKKLVQVPPNWIHQGTWSQATQKLKQTGFTHLHFLIVELQTLGTKSLDPKDSKNMVTALVVNGKLFDENFQVKELT